MPPLAIEGRPIGANHPPYIIAEVSANHGGDLGRAKRIIELAAAAGADAVKFQLYTADSLTLDINRPEFRIGDKSNLWSGERLYDLYARAATPAAWFPELFDHARQHGVTPFASVFDEAGICLLEELEAPAYKIASFEAVDLDLIRACAQTGKPVIVSTGLCTDGEIDDAVRAFYEGSGRGLCLLHCNSGYPADPAEANLLTIPDLSERFEIPIGYSDHTCDAMQAVVAVALGACAIEKHVIDAREPPTPDSAFSALPDQLRELVEGCRSAFVARGQVAYGPTPRERGSLVFRRSLFAVRPVQAGERFTRENVRSVRPGMGLLPKHLPQVLASTASRDVEAGTPLSWDLLS